MTDTEIAAALTAPFDPMEVDFRPGTGSQVLAYIDVTTAERRLTAVFGPLGWSFTWDPLVISAGQARSKTSDPPPHDVVWIVRGTLTIGESVHSDVGDADANETTKAAVSDALKRCAAQIGIGAYLRDLRRMEARIENYAVPDHEKTRLRVTYLSMAPPAGYQPAQTNEAQQQTRSAPPPPREAQRPATARPAPEAATATPRVNVVVGDPLEDAKIKTLAYVAAQYEWGMAELTAIMEAHITPGSRIGQAGLSRWRALYQYISKHGLAALPSLAAVQVGA